MTTDDLLFPMPEPDSTRPTLESLRAAYEKAVRELDAAERADEDNDGFGIVPDELRQAVITARRALHDEELRKFVQ